MNHRLIGLALVGLVTAGVAQASHEMQVIQWVKDNNLKELIKSDEEDQWVSWREKCKMQPLIFVTSETYFSDSVTVCPSRCTFDYVVLYGSADTIKKFLEFNAERIKKGSQTDLFGNRLYGFEDDVPYRSPLTSFDTVPILQFMINIGMYIANPVATLAAAGELEKLKTFVGILESMLKEMNAEAQLGDYLSYPMTNFGTGNAQERFIVGGNALVLALLNGHIEVAKYLLEKGAEVRGSIRDTDKVLIANSYDGKFDSDTLKLEDLNVEALVKKSGLVASEKSKKNLEAYRRESMRIKAKQAEQDKKAEEQRAAEKKAEIIARLRKLSKDELLTMLIDSFGSSNTAKSWDLVQAIAEINPSILTTKIEKDGVPLARTSSSYKKLEYLPILNAAITGYSDWELVKYLFEQHKSQKRPLSKNDIENIIRKIRPMGFMEERHQFRAYLKAEGLATDNEIKDIDSKMDREYELAKKTSADTEVGPRAMN